MLRKWRRKRAGTVTALIGKGQCRLRVTVVSKLGRLVWRKVKVRVRMTETLVGGDMRMGSYCLPWITRPSRTVPCVEMCMSRCRGWRRCQVVESMRRLPCLALSLTASIARALARRS